MCPLAAECRIRMPRLSTCPLILILIGIAATQLMLSRIFHLSEDGAEHAYAGIIRRLNEFADRTIPPSSQNAPLSFGACCGIGHRFERIIKTVTFAKQNHRTAFAHWPDVPWSYLFHDTALVKMASADTEREKEHYANGQPKEWWRSPSDIVRNASQHLKVTLDDETSTVYDRYVHQLLEMETAQDVAEQFRQSLSDKVLAYLEPLRSQYATRSANGLHICVHIRTGNNETGAWQIASQRRDLDVNKVLNGTLNAMLHYANESGASRDGRDISVFVASDLCFNRGFRSTGESYRVANLLQGQDLGCSLASTGAKLQLHSHKISGMRPWRKGLLTFLHSVSAVPCSFQHTAALQF